MGSFAYAHTKTPSYLCSFLSVASRICSVDVLSFPASSWLRRSIHNKLTCALWCRARRSCSAQLYLGILVTLVFPTLATAVYFALLFTPMGDVVSPAYSQIDNTSIIMVRTPLISFFGIFM